MNSYGPDCDCSLKKACTMIKIKAIIFGIFMFLVGGAFPVFAQDYVAVVQDVIGTVQVKQQQSQSKKMLKAGENLAIGDIVLTSENGYAKIIFTDETSIVVSGAGGRFTIDDYVFDPQNPTSGKARFDILRAGFLFVSGQLGKADRPDVEIALDFGTIGIRGTKIRRAMRDGECWILLEDGKIRVSNIAGSVLLHPGEGTRMGSLKKSPTKPGVWSAENVDWILQETSWPGVIDDEDFQQKESVETIVEEELKHSAGDFVQEDDRVSKNKRIPNFLDGSDL